MSDDGVETTARLILTRPTPDDVDDLHRICSDTTGVAALPEHAAP